VRSTGAGMGCPDWPKCFGQWIPPTEVSQLPEDYKEIYAEKRKTKNNRLAQMLQNMGFTNLSKKIEGDASTYVEADFNATKTWIEYVNRLVGVLIGFFIFLTLLFSFSYRKVNYKIPLYSFIAFILVGIQGWIGSVVVSTNLLTGIITIHMLLAIVIVMLLIYAVSRTYHYQDLTINRGQQIFLNRLLILTTFITLGQVLLGTQVREGIDVIARVLGSEGRSMWVEQSGTVFYIHRSFSWLVLITHGYLAYYVFKKIPTQVSNLTKRLALGLISIIIIETFTGIGMAYFSIPAFLQPVHLFLAVVALGILFILWQVINYPKLSLQQQVNTSKPVQV
jgi:cytochrome c oxidase assembly protein subunit 15